MITVYNLHIPGLQAAVASLYPADIQKIVRNLGQTARKRWVMEAGKALMTSRADYINGIQAPVYQPGVVAISLVGVVPNIVENGMEQKDLHDTLLGPKVPSVPLGERGKHPKKDGSGYYRAIPFRHQTPGTAGVAAAPMGFAYRDEPGVDPEKLGKAVAAKARKLAPTKSAPYGGTAYGGRLPAGVGGAYPMKRKHAPGHHATDIYAGMIKKTKEYNQATKGKKAQATYMTFRTIATGSPGWVRGKTEGKKLAQAVVKAVAKAAPGAVKAYMKGVGV